MLDEAVPGNIRKAEHFVAFLKRFIEYLKVDTRSILTHKAANSLKDADESASRRRRDTAIFSRPPQGDHLY